MKKVLIVEPDRNVAEGYGNHLSREGYEIEYVPDGEAGLSKVKEFGPDIIMLALEMPKQDAISVLAILKADDKTRNIPVLILAKHYEPKTRMEAAKLGVTVYFEKAKLSNELLSVWVNELTAVRQEGISEIKPKQKKKAKVLLLVEDDPLMLNLYQKAFKLEGFQVDIAKGGRQALEKVKKEKPGIILLDIMMPEIDGFEVLSHLKADSETKDIPVVILTNLAGRKDAERGLALGAVKYLVKSEYEPKDVAGLVREILQGPNSAPKKNS